MDDEYAYEARDDYEGDVYGGYDGAGDDPIRNWPSIADQDEGDALSVNDDGSNDGSSVSGAFNMSSIEETLENEISPTGDTQFWSSEEERGGW